MSLTFSYCFKNPLKNLTNFNGRTRRREYWFYCLGVVLFIIVPLAAVLLLGGVDKEIAKLICRIIHPLLVISITVRRLHDIDRSGWWVLLVLIPIIGDIALLIFMCQKGTKGENRFGKDPTAEDERTLDTTNKQKLIKYCR